jgi:4,5:9,10-diseco-3-hydroxy-5,9,17-trioxoandrosta-1(10),2-diene-4-oate hydrolase
MSAEEHNVYVIDEPVRYFVAGSGPPLFLLHGLGESAMVWHETIAPLSERFTVYAPDLLGHGHTGKPRHDYTPALGVAFVVALMDTLHIQSAHLLGNSLGGLVAAVTTISHPDRVRSLVLENTAGLGRETAAFLRLMTLPLVGDLLAMPTRWTLRRLMRILLYDPTAISNQFFEALYQDRRVPGNKQALLRMLRAGVDWRGMKPSVRFDDQLAAISAPTLLVCGREDPLFPLAHAERAASLMPNAQLHVFEQCRHWPHMEHATEFSTLVSDFMAAQEIGD